MSHSFNLSCRTIAILCFCFPFTLAAGDRDSTELWYDPFSEEFLDVCGQNTVLGRGFPNAGTLPQKQNGVGFTVELTQDGRSYFCSFSGHFSSDITALGDADALEYQPAWLENPAVVGETFDQWIELQQESLDLRPANGCLSPIDDQDPVTARIYARAITVADTGRVIVVEITQREKSYLDPDRGYDVFLFGWTSNARADCV